MYRVIERFRAFSVFGVLRRNPVGSMNTLACVQQTNTRHSPFYDNPEQYVGTICITHPEYIIPMRRYRVMDANGKLIDPQRDTTEFVENAVKLYQTMTTLKIMDDIIIDNVQHHGGVSVHAPQYGEEATIVGSGAGLALEDLVFSQYRETGVLLYRGFGLDALMSQFTSSAKDSAHGRQMAVHLGSREFNFVTVSTPLATQLPQAAGAAYAFKRANSGRCVVAYFGEGTAAEGDTHAAFTFASTLHCPVLFFCRNNQVSISSPAVEQYAGDGIASHGSGYGMATIRVDGNDVFAVMEATRAARDVAVAEGRPVLVEAMTYRMGGHTTLVDLPVEYRRAEELAHWANLDPIVRLRRFMEDRGLWDEQKENHWIRTRTEEMLGHLDRALHDSLEKPEKVLFDDVYSEIPRHLQQQRERMVAHIAKYPDVYEPLMNSRD